MHDDVARDVGEAGDVEFLADARDRHLGAAEDFKRRVVGERSELAGELAGDERGERSAGADELRRRRAAEEDELAAEFDPPAEGGDARVVGREVAVELGLAAAEDERFNAFVAAAVAFGITSAGGPIPNCANL